MQVKGNKHYSSCIPSDADTLLNGHGNIRSISTARGTLSLLVDVDCGRTVGNNMT
ncbi:hypothetical protein A2U01_0101643, partial [Trifolium medium]|nr:hypothetical protein [Trifolium medium]